MIHTQTEIDNLVELAIIQRAELKRLVESLPQLREHLSSEIERNLEEIEPAIRSELEQFVAVRASDAHAQTSAALTAKIDELARSLETTTAARYSVLMVEREKNERFAQLAEQKIAAAAAELPTNVKSIVLDELSRFPRANQIDQLRKEFAEPASLNPRGKWQAGETYNKLDLVSINGSSFIANETTSEKPSSASEQWTLSASRGNGGAGGGVTSLTDLVAVPNNGELLIGNGSGFVESTLTAGTGIAITNGAGSITVSATGGVAFQGSWNASTNTPTLTSSVGTTGFFYIVSVAGSTNLNGITDWEVGDWAIFGTSTWTKVDNTDKVSSVFGRVGSVVGISTDYSSVGITATAVGASSPSTGAFTTLSATTPLAVASGGTGVASSTGTTNVVLSGSPTITTPVIAQINDANGNETLKLASIASAVNEVTIENAATGNAVHISATGGDASVGLHLAGKGASGYVNVQDSVDATKRIMFNAAGGTTNTRTMLSSTQTVDRILSLPDATDTLVGKATTDTLTNKTLTSPTITGGALNGTLGATTPSTGAFTTLNATGAVTGGDAVFGNIAGERTLSVSATDRPLTMYSNSTADPALYWKTGSALRFGATTNGISSAGFSQYGVITATGLNSIAIGATTVSTGAFSTLSATGITSITNSTASTSTTTGALTVAGGLGVAGAAYIGGALSAGESVTFNFSPAGSVSITRLLTDFNLRSVDNTEDPKFRISDSRTNGTVFQVSTRTAAVEISGTLSATGALAIGNTVNTVSPTSPNRTVTIVIGGTTYYLAAKTTND